MKPLAEFAPFLALAVVVHIGAFAMVARGGVSSGGDGGTEQFTLQGGDPGMAALVAAWERAPEVPQPLAAPVDLLSAPEALPEAPNASVPAPVHALQALSPPATAPESLIDTAPPDTPLMIPAIPAPTPDLPPLVETLPSAPASVPRSPLAALAETLQPAHEAPVALPDSTPPPPPLALASAPERSPIPPSRPQPRSETQTTRAQPAPTAGAPAPAQRAAGTGAQARDGQGSSTETSRAQVDAGGLVAQWGGAIRSAVQRQQRHPAGTRAGGTVHLRLDVHSDGRLLTVALRESSGHAALDQAAIDAVRRARLPAAPQGLSGSYQFNLPVRFRG